LLHPSSPTDCLHLHPKGPGGSLQLTPVTTFAGRKVFCHDGKQ
jgi:hypothetical protein